MGNALRAHGDHLRPEKRCGIGWRGSTTRPLCCRVVALCLCVSVVKDLRRKDYNRHKDTEVEQRTPKESPNEDLYKKNPADCSYFHSCFDNSRLRICSSTSKPGALFPRIGARRNQRQADDPLQLRCPKQGCLSGRHVRKIAESAALRH